MNRTGEPAPADGMVPARTGLPGAATRPPRQQSRPTRVTPQVTTPVWARQAVRSGRETWWRRRRRLVLALLVVAGIAGWLGYDVTSGGSTTRDVLDVHQWTARLHEGWALLAVAGVVVTLAGNAWNLCGASPVRLRFWPTLVAQIAGTPLRMVSPQGVGAAALNVQFLRRAGVGGVASVGTVSVAQAVQVLLTLCLLPFALVAAGMDVELPGVNGVWVAGALGAVLAVVVTVLLWYVRRGRAARARLTRLLRELTHSLRVIAADRTRAVVSIAGALLVTVGMVLALWSSIHAFGGSVALLTATGVLLVAATAGNVVPVPGGVGSVEAALVAGLTATGTPLQVAVPAVGLYRLVTLWLLIPVGVVSLGLLRRSGRL